MGKLGLGVVLFDHADDLLGDNHMKMSPPLVHRPLFHRAVIGTQFVGNLRPTFFANGDQDLIGRRAPVQQLVSNLGNRSQIHGALNYTGAPHA